MSYASQLAAWQSGARRPLGDIDALGLDIAEDERVCANHRLLADADAVAQGAVDTEKALLAHRHAARDDNMRGNEAEASDRGTITDEIPAPVRDVVAEG